MEGAFGNRGTQRVRDCGTILSRPLQVTFSRSRELQALGPPDVGDSTCCGNVTTSHLWVYDLAATKASIGGLSGASRRGRLDFCGRKDCIVSLNCVITDLGPP